VDVVDQVSETSGSWDHGHAPVQADLDGREFLALLGRVHADAQIQNLSNELLCRAKDGVM